MRRAKQQSITQPILSDAPTMRDDKKLSRGKAIANSSKHPCLKRFVLVFGFGRVAKLLQSDQRDDKREKITQLINSAGHKAAYANIYARCDGSLSEILSRKGFGLRVAQRRATFAGSCQAAHKLVSE